MKIKNILTISLLVLLTGCSTRDKSGNYSPIDGGYDPYVPSSNVTVMCPTGAPAIAMSGYAAVSDFQTTADPSLLSGYLAQGNYDMIVAPTDVGVKAIKQGCNYRIGATITFGNFFLVPTGLDENGKLDSGDSIVLFQQGGLPDKIFHYVYGNEYDSNITYVKNVAIAATSYETKEVTTAEGSKKSVDYVLLSEPKLTAINAKSGAIDLSEEFKAKSKVTKIFQASIFVNKFTSMDTAFELAKIRNSIKRMLSSTNEMEANMNRQSDPQTFFGVPTNVAAKVTENNNGFALGFEYAEDSLTWLNSYLTVLGVENLTENEVFKE